MRYSDFEVKIASLRGIYGEYSVSVGRSPAGESEHDEVARLTLDSAELEARTTSLREAVHNARGRSRADHISVAATRSASELARNFGQILFQTFFTGQVGDLYRDSVREARRTQTGLRIKLRADAPEISELPWEFLHDRNDFVCLSNVTPLVRYLPMAEPSPPLAVTGPLRILGMIASPEDLAQLDAARERKIVERAFSYVKTQEERDVRITWVADQTYEALDQALSPNGEGPFHVFHFIGHGGKGQLFLATKERRSRSDPITGIDLGRLLRDHGTMRLAVLNSCYGARGTGLDPFSSVASSIVRQGLPAVVSMQHEVSDDGAIEFAQAFYSRIAGGSPIDAAVSDARKRMSRLPFALEWATPVLHMRSPDGRLFQIGKASLGVQADVRKPAPKKKAVEELRQSAPSGKKSAPPSAGSKPTTPARKKAPTDTRKTERAPKQTAPPNSQPTPQDPSFSSRYENSFSRPKVPLSTPTESSATTPNALAGVPSPRLRVSHGSIDFEERESGKSYVVHLGLSNSGTGQLSWSATVRGSAFKIKSTETGLDVFLVAAEAGTHLGELEVKSNGGEITLPIKARLRPGGGATSSDLAKAKDAEKPVMRGNEVQNTAEPKEDSPWSTFFGCLFWIVVAFFVVKGCVEGT